MKRLLTLALCACFSSIIAQNLVENPSLEATQCPIFSPNPSDYIAPWTTYFGAPDYFEANCGNPGTAATTNNSQPFDGSGFLGIEVYGQVGTVYNRDYIHGELTEPLEAGKFYRASFYVKPVNFPGPGSYGINNIGLLVTDTVLGTTPANNVLEYNPTIKATDVIVNTSFWTPVCGVFKATGNEKYLTIGNFGLDQETSIDPLLNANNPTTAYYLIDFVEIVENDFPELPQDTVICQQGRVDINITQLDFTYQWQDGSGSGTYLITRPGTYYVDINSPSCSYRDSIKVVEVECADCKVFAPNAFTPNEDGINDKFELQANCDLVSYRFQVFDRWGQKHFESTDIEVSWDGGNVDKGGTFTYSLEYEFELFEKTETITRRGMITLIK